MPARRFVQRQLPPNLIEDFAGDVTRLSEAAHRMRRSWPIALVT